MQAASTAKNDRKKGGAGGKARHGIVRRTRFKVKARPQSVVYIAGTFNRWDPLADRMEPDGSGYYFASLLLPVGRHEYKYVIDGIWHLDPECPRLVGNALGSHNHVIEII